MASCLGVKVYSSVPEGDWGWVVALTFFVVEVCTYGTLKSLGVFLHDLMQDFGESNSRVSWAVSICIFTFNFTAPVSTLLSTRFGHRPVVMTGGFLMSLGTICSAFTSSIYHLYVTIGVITGLGYSLSFLPTVTLLAQYFSRRRALITPLASSGESFAMFAFGPALTALKELIGWRHCMVLLGILQASVIGCGLLLCPIRIQPDQEPEPEAERALSEKDLEAVYDLDNGQTHRSISSSRDSEDSGVTSLCSSQGEQEKVEAEPLMERRPPLLDLSVLRDAGFVCYSLFGLLSTVGFFAPQLYVIELSKSRGVEAHLSSYTLSVMAVGDVVGRLTIGLVLTRARCRKTRVLLGCVLALCLVLAAFTLAQGFWALVVCSAIYGYFMGAVGSTHIPLLAEEDVVGLSRMASAVGVYVCIQSFAGLAGPPLGGVLVDMMQNYGAAFALCAGGMALSAVFLALVSPVRSCRCSGAPHEELRDRDSEKLDFLDVDLCPEDVNLSPEDVDLSPQDSPERRQAAL